MKNKIQVFKNKEFGEIKVIVVNGEPYFIANEVTEILGYSDMSKALRGKVYEGDVLHLFFTEILGYSDMSKALRGKVYEGDVLHLFFNDSGCYSEICVVSRNGLYSLEDSSNIVNLQGFISWIYSGVLPNINTDNSVSTETITGEYLIENIDFAIKLFTLFKEVRKQENFAVSK